MAAAAGTPRTHIVLDGGGSFGVTSSHTMEEILAGSLAALERFLKSDRSDEELEELRKSMQELVEGRIAPKNVMIEWGLDRLRGRIHPEADVSSLAIEENKVMLLRPSNARGAMPKTLVEVTRTEEAFRSRFATG